MKAKLPDNTEKPRAVLSTDERSRAPSAKSGRLRALRSVASNGSSELSDEHALSDESETPMQGDSAPHDAPIERSPPAPAASVQGGRVVDHAALAVVRLLIERCVAGEQSAMIALVERFQGQVFGLCYRMLGQRQDAEDVVQETFVRVLKNLHRWDPTREFEPWLLAIAGNRCRTALSVRKRRPSVELIADQLADHTPDRSLVDTLSEEVSLALGQTRSEYREAFVLFHEQQLSYAEIAESMNVPLGTVKTWVHRARKELIEHLHRRGVVPECRDALPRV